MGENKKSVVVVVEISVDDTYGCEGQPHKV